MGTPKFWLRSTIVLILALSMLGIITIKLTSQPGFCGSCHDMSSAITSWHNSTHDKFSCFSCHKLSPIDKGVMIFGHYSEQEVVSTSKPVECVRCHRESRVVTPSGDITIPHQFHIEQNIPCGNCHPGAGHISSSSINSSSSIAKYPTQVMSLCLRCHYKKQGPLSCKACHIRPPVTLAHYQPSWKSNHGAAAFENLAACNSCHSFTLFLDENRPNKPSSELSSPTVYSRDNAFCADCHRKRPASHNEYFLHDHAYIKTTDSCMVCHQWNYPLPTENAPNAYCQKCHVYPGWVPYLYGDPRLQNQPQKELGP